MTDLPSVSCIMPCGYGDKYVAVAIECFMRQNYAAPLELVVVDDNDPGHTIEHVLPTADTEGQDAISYLQCERTSVGSLRNIGSQVARGEVLISWDEDDWSHPDRVASQVERLRTSGKAVTGWHSILFYDTSTNFCYKYHFANHPHPPYACGTSHCYTKAWWTNHPYPETGIEDYQFQKTAADHGQLDSTDADQLCVVRAHKDSKCPPQFVGRQWSQVERSLLPHEFFIAIER